MSKAHEQEIHRLAAIAFDEWTAHTKYEAIHVIRLLLIEIEKFEKRILDLETDKQELTDEVDTLTAENGELTLWIGGQM